MANYKGVRPDYNYEEAVDQRKLDKIKKEAQEFEKKERKKRRLIEDEKRRKVLTDRDREDIKKKRIEVEACKKKLKKLRSESSDSFYAVMRGITLTCFILLIIVTIISTMNGLEKSAVVFLLMISVVVLIISIIIQSEAVNMDTRIRNCLQKLHTAQHELNSLEKKLKNSQKPSLD